MLIVTEPGGVGAVLPYGSVDPAMCYSAVVPGADRIFALGGEQAPAAMAFGLLNAPPVGMLVGAGNAHVTAAKRRLFGRVALDLLAGAPEVAVLADNTAVASTVAADLLGQAGHGPESPAALVTTCEGLARSAIEEVDPQPPTLPIESIAGRHGGITT